MLYSTVTDIYRSFLKEIKKSNIASVPPSVFNTIINDAYSLWYRDKSTEIERDQKRMDDLKELIVVTDGVFMFEGHVLPAIQPTSTNLFPLPKALDNTATVTINNVVYPSYRRLLSVEFKYQYVNDPCYPDGQLSDWISSSPLRANQEAELKKSAFRKPTRNKIYHKLIGNNVKLWLGDNTSNIGRFMKIEYIKYPRQIFFDSTGVNNVMCELQSDQIHEIVKIAARTYLQEATDPRYQTEINEMALSQKGK